MRGVLAWIALLGACAAAPQVQDKTWYWLGSLSGQSWVAAPKPESYTLQFLDGRAAIRADCNRATGNATLKGDAVSFGPMAMTMMACPPASRGDVYAMQLGSAERLQARDGALTLAIMGGGTMFFAQDPAARLAHYRCREGAMLSALFAGEQAQVWFAGEYYRLPRERSASGARYSDGKTAFDTKGVLGTLRKDGAALAENCQVPSTGG